MIHKLRPFTRIRISGTAFYAENGLRTGHEIKVRRLLCTVACHWDPGTCIEELKVWVDCSRQPRLPTPRFPKFMDRPPRAPIRDGGRWYFYPPYRIEVVK